MKRCDVCGKVDREHRFDVSVNDRRSRSVDVCSPECLHAHASEWRQRVDDAEREMAEWRARREAESAELTV